MGSSEPLRFAQLKLELKLCPRLGPEVAALKFQPLHELLPVGALGTDSPFSLHFFPANRRSTGQESGQEGIDNRQSERDEVRSQKPRRVQHERHQDHLGEQLGYTTGTLAPSAGNTPPAKLPARIARLNHRSVSTQFREAIAERTDIAALQKACPQSFAPFAARLRSRFGQ